MIGFLLGAATGYVLGARAGRERYEQIVRTYHQIADHPAVQGAAGVARAKVSDAVRTGVQTVRGPSRDATVQPDPRPPVAAVPRS